MNTINSAVPMAMDGQTLPKSAKAGSKAKVVIPQQNIVPSREDVAEKIEQKMAKSKADIQEIRRISKIVAGNKLQFNVNKELNTVIISVIDAETEQVVRQIPSEDMQKLKLRIRQAIGSLFDEKI